METDEELLDRLLSGDDQAFGQMVERYHGRLVRLAISFVGTELAEEVAQETWIAVLRGAAAFERRSSWRTWLYRICVNRSRSIGAREHRTAPVDLAGPTVDPARFTSGGQWAAPPGDWTDAVDDRLVANDLIGAARAAIDALPDSQGQVVTLRDVEGLSSQEVCEVLSISSANERVLLHRGRSRVRAELAEQMRGGGE